MKTTTLYRLRAHLRGETFFDTGRLADSEELIEELEIEMSKNAAFKRAVKQCEREGISGPVSIPIVEA